MGSMMRNRKTLLIWLLGILLVVAAGAWMQRSRTHAPVRIGVLHSLSGTMALSEAPLVDAVRLAVEEVNRSGGVNGAPVEMVVADCRSDAAYCAQQAERLIAQEGVRALFGCWTSVCRKAVKGVVERHHHLLFYPLQYEGLERSPDIFYTGAAPNQQVIPMVNWALQQRGRRAFLIGSDYVFPRTANRIVRELLSAQGAEALAERYVPLGERDFAAVVHEIAALHPDFVVNTLNGDSNRYFFAALQEAGLSATEIPVFSTSLAEAEMTAIGGRLTAGHYVAWNYFQSLPGQANTEFVARFRQRFGSQRVLDDPMEASYIGVQLWAHAANSAGTLDLPTVKNVLGATTLSAPEGIVAVDAGTHHLWKTVRIGRARVDGQVDVVWQSPCDIAPAPFPFFMPYAELQSMSAEGGR